MHNDNRSLNLTRIIIRVCYVLLFAAAVGLSFLFDHKVGGVMIIKEYQPVLAASFWLVVPAGYVTLISLDILLGNIKNGICFDNRNVKLLRLISWMCFYAALLSVVFFVIMLVRGAMVYSYPVLGAGEVFVALIVRVVKNMFEKAIAIKEENDLTI